MIAEPPANSEWPVANDVAQITPSWSSWFTQIWLNLVYMTFSPVVTITAAYQILLTDSVVLINGNVTATLPTARKGVNKRITCKAINAGGGTRTVSGNGANIDGAATWTTTTQYDSAEFVSNGTQWYKV